MPPPLRVRHARDNPNRIIEVGWSPDLDVTWPLPFAILTDDPRHVSDPDDIPAHDPSDPTIPEAEDYPRVAEAAILLAPDLVERVARHWERVHPHMRRFTHTELEQATFLAALGDTRAGLHALAEQRPGYCEFTLQKADE